MIIIDEFIMSIRECKRERTNFPDYAGLSGGFFGGEGGCSNEEIFEPIFGITFSVQPPGGRQPAVYETAINLNFLYSGLLHANYML
jgi:hypothetical protein